MSKKKPIFDILKSFFGETMSSRIFNGLLPTKVYIYNDTDSKKVRASTKKNKKWEMVGECFLDDVQENTRKYSELFGYKNSNVSAYCLTNKNFSRPKTEKQLAASRRSYKGCIKNPKVGITWGQMAKDHPEFYSSVMKKVAKGLSERGHYKEIGSIGAKEINKRRREDGTLDSHMRMMHSHITPEIRKRMTEKFIRMAKERPISEEQRERCREMGKKWGGINYHKGMEIIKFSPLKSEWSSKGGLAGGAKKAIERGTHNFLSQSPNNKQVICPDGMVSSAPSAILYCKSKNLDQSLIKDLVPGYIENLDLLIIDAMKDRGFMKLKDILLLVDGMPEQMLKKRILEMTKDGRVCTQGGTSNKKYSV